MPASRIAPLAALIAIVLVIAGCGSSGSDATGTDPGDGKQIFSDSGCAGCHKFAPAGSNGGSGPDLDGITLDVAAIEAQVRSGGGGMPSFDGDLTDQQITAVAEFVAGD